jgi:monothiol glutaredoxin
MSDSQNVQDWIRKTIASNDVVLFMKGNHQMPQCGFSGRVVQILDHMGIPFKDVNVLDDMSIREGIKQFTNWPTIPQLYVKGEFVGGADIVTEMFQSGELEELVHEKGIKHVHHHA